MSEPTFTIETKPSSGGHYRWVICALLFFATTINYVDRSVFGVLEPELHKIIGWSATDASLAAATMKIEYQDAAGSGGAWQPVEPQAAAAADATQAKGQTVFHPAVASRSINLRAEIADAICFMIQNAAVSGSLWADAGWRPTA